MNFFNIDLHISVIADLKQIFHKLGHTVNDKCLSDHGFVMGRTKDVTRIVDSNNWWQLDQSMCDAFYREYKNELATYDGFICAYPPAFALLYEKFDKPIIIQAPIRFEVPFHNDSNRPYGRRLTWFIDFLKRGIDNKQIIAVANSQYEKDYCEYYTHREWQYIPNICDYTGIHYTGEGKDYILYAHSPFNCNHPNVKTKDDYLGRNYKWSKFNDVKGIIHIPYNVSTMSIFEQYTASIPLLFPTVRFLNELVEKGMAMQDITWNKSTVELTHLLPNWLNKSMFYDTDWFPHIQYFDSFNQLKSMIESQDIKPIYESMKSHNITKNERIENTWYKLINERIGQHDRKRN